MSTDTRDLVAATIAAHVDRIGAIDPTRATYCGCSCGEAFAIPLPPRPIPGHWLLEVWLPAFRAHRADAVLTALTEAGALLPAGSEMVELWGVKAPDGVIWADPRTKAEAWKSVLRQGAEARLVARSVYYGPWREVPDGD